MKFDDTATETDASGPVSAFSGVNVAVYLAGSLLTGRGGCRSSFNLDDKGDAAKTKEQIQHQIR